MVMKFAKINYTLSFQNLQEECMRLRQSIKCGLISRLNVVIIYVLNGLISWLAGNFA